MTVPSQTPINQYTANGVTTVFAYTFRIDSESDIKIYSGDSVIASGFTVSGVGVNSGGAITFSTAPASGSIITLLRNMDPLRATDYQNSGDFRAETANGDFDKLWLYMQQLRRDVDKSLHRKENDTHATTLNILPAPETGKALAWGPNGDVVNRSIDQTTIIGNGEASDISAGLVFNTVADAQTLSAADGRTIGIIDILPLSTSVATARILAHDSTGKKGWAFYKIASLVQHRTDINDPSWVPNNDDSYYLLGGTTYVMVQSYPAIGGNLIERGSASNTLIRSLEDGATRVHIEPRGRIVGGTTSKLDLMMDPYEDDPVNYRIGNFYAKVGDTDGLNGENGAFIINVKGAGKQWGIFPSFHFSFSDDALPGVPMKIYYYDTEDTEWRTPQRGLWISGETYSADDYCLSEYKIYKATSSGTAGGTAPSHGTGTETDGGVSWEFIRDYLVSVANDWIQPVVLFGDRSDMPLFGHQNVRVQFHKNAMFKNGYRLLFVDEYSDTLGWIGKRSDSESIQIDMADDSRVQFFPGYVKSVGMGRVMAAAEKDTGTTIDVQASEFIEFNHESATTVTAFTTRVNQRFYVAAKNGNTTIQHNVGIRLIGGVNKTLGADDALCFIVKTDGVVVQVQG